MRYVDYFKEKEFQLNELTEHGCDNRMFRSKCKDWLGC